MVIRITKKKCRLKRAAKMEAALELIDFKRRVDATGIADHLSPVALTLMFLALGRKMWREYERKDILDSFGEDGDGCIEASGIGQ